jgi:hypothetical protein
MESDKFLLKLKMETLQLSLPQRPQRTGKSPFLPIKLRTNLYPLCIKDKKQDNCVYSFKIEPSIEKDARALRYKIRKLLLFFYLPTFFNSIIFKTFF